MVLFIQMYGLMHGKATWYNHHCTLYHTHETHAMKRPMMKVLHSLKLKSNIVVAKVFQTVNWNVNRWISWRKCWGIRIGLAQVFVPYPLTPSFSIPSQITLRNFPGFWFFSHFSTFYHLPSLERDFKSLAVRKRFPLISFFDLFSFNFYAEL